MAINEPIGVMGLVCADAHPLLGFVSLVAPAIAMGNTVVACPRSATRSPRPTCIRCWRPRTCRPGVVNIVTGPRDALARVLAEHDDVDALWYAGPAEGVAGFEAASAGNMKRTWMLQGPRAIGWTPRKAQGGSSCAGHPGQEYLGALR